MFNKQQVIVVLILVGLLVGSVLLFILASQKLNRLSDDVKDNVGQTPIKIEKVVDQEALAQAYLEQSEKIINDYFSAVQAEGADLAGLSASAQTELLNLTLPASNKEKHLAQVLLLGEIADLERDNKHQMAIDKLNKLKELSIQK